MPYIDGTPAKQHPSRVSPVAPLAGDPQAIERIKELLADLEPDRADLLRAFHRIQHEFKYVPREAIPLLAGKFRTTNAMIYGAIDFYAEVRQEPPAEHEVQWCSGPACRLKGSEEIRRGLEATLGCDLDEKTEDELYGLRLVQCDGTCHLAPLIRYEGRYIGPLTSSKAIEWARELKQSHGSDNGQWQQHQEAPDTESGDADATL